MAFSGSAQAFCVVCSARPLRHPGASRPPAEATCHWRSVEADGCALCPFRNAEVQRKFRGLGNCYREGYIPFVRILAFLRKRESGSALCPSQRLRTVVDQQKLRIPSRPLTFSSLPAPSAGRKKERTDAAVSIWNAVIWARQPITHHRPSKTLLLHRRMN
jgi:hypothetical protein